MNKKIEYYSEYYKKIIATVSEAESGLYFEYDKNWNGMSLDPSLPLSFTGILNDWQIQGLMDFLPVSTNPRYKDYCLKWGISPDTSDVLTLLCTVGFRTSSIAICRPVGWVPGIWSKLLKSA